MDESGNPGFLIREDGSLRVRPDDARERLMPLIDAVRARL